MAQEASGREEMVPLAPDLCIMFWRPLFTRQNDDVLEEFSTAIGGTRGARFAGTFLHAWLNASMSVPEVAVSGCF